MLGNSGGGGTVAQEMAQRIVAAQSVWCGGSSLITTVDTETVLTETALANACEQDVHDDDNHDDEKFELSSTHRQASRDSPC